MHSSGAILTAAPHSPCVRTCQWYVLRPAGTEGCIDFRQVSKFRILRESWTTLCRWPVLCNLCLCRLISHTHATLWRRILLQTAWELAHFVTVWSAYFCRNCKKHWKILFRKSGFNLTTFASHYSACDLLGIKQRFMIFSRDSVILNYISFHHYVHS
jgi:hypothetical protein